MIKRALTCFAALAALAFVTGAPLAAATLMSHPPGYTLTEPIQISIPNNDAIKPDATTGAFFTRADIRPTVAVFNRRTCSARVPDSTGRLVATTWTHRTYAVPWLRCA